MNIFSHESGAERSLAKSIADLINVLPPPTEFLNYYDQFNSPLLRSRLIEIRNLFTLCKPSHRDLLLKRLIRKPTADLSELALNEDSFRGLFINRVAAAFHMASSIRPFLKENMPVLVLSVGYGFELMVLNKFRIRSVGTTLPKSKIMGLKKYGDYAVRHELNYELLRKNLNYFSQIETIEQIFSPNNYGLNYEERCSIICANELAIHQFIPNKECLQRFLLALSQISNHIHLYDTAVVVSNDPSWQNWLNEINDDPKINFKISLNSHICTNTIDTNGCIRKDIIIECT